METLCAADCDRASEISFCLDDEVPPEAVLNAEETEELKQSLKDVVHTEDVKPKLQCLMSNPCFSMVTVQCEDSGIHWETSSSRCSTPWASEASTTSDVYSMESSSVGTPPGKVIFIMDEDKLRRKRVRPSSQYSRHASHEKKSLSHQKQSAENMGNAVKEAIEKARSQSSILTERTNNINGSKEVTKILELKSISIPENQAKKKTSIDSGVHVLNTVSEQADEVKEESIQDVSEKSSTKASLDDAKSIPDIKQSFPKDSIYPLDFQQMGSTLDSSVNGLSKKSAAVSSPLISQAENHLSTEKVDRVSKQENYNLSHVPSEKKQEDIEFNTLQRPYTEPEESIINSSLSGDRLDQEEPLLLNPSFIQSLTEPPSSLPLYFTDTDENPSPKISTIEMLVEHLLNETTKSALEQSSRQNLSDEPKEEQTQETMESKMEPSYRYVQGNISSVLGDNERQRERFTMAPIEEVFEESIQDVSEKSSTKASLDDAKSIPDIKQSFPKDSIYPLDFQQMGSTLDSSVNGLSKKSAAVSSPLISQAENHLATEKVDRVSKQENYNLTHAPSQKKQEDIEFNTLQRPYTEPEESIINSSLSGDRLDQEEPLLLNPSFIQSLTEPPSSLPLYFTDTDENPSPKISTIEMLVEHLLNETTKSALEQSSRQNLSDEPKEEQTQETMESKMEPSYRYVQGNISSVLGDNERQRERFTMAPIEEVFDIPPSSSLTAATNNSVKQPSGSLRTMDLASENTPNLLYPEEQTVTHQKMYLDTKEPPDTQSDVFSIVSEGSEILNIIAPQLISSVDQEASDEMQDRLEYLNETPLLMPKLLHQEENALVKPNISVDTHLEANQDMRPQLKKGESGEEHAKKMDSANIRQYNASKSITDIDYFEKFTLIDDKMPVGSEVAKATHVEKAKLKSELSDNFKDSLEDEYYMLENLDESFYGVMKSDDTMTDYGSFKFERSTANKEDTQTQESDVKPTGTSLFNPEEEVLCKSLFFPTSYPINPELLREPPALAFLYEDLYEQATKDENEPSDAESTASGATFHSRISDDDGTGIYFEKYILKDEIPFDKVKPKEVKDLVDDLDSDSPIISQTEPQTNSLRREQVFGDSCNSEIPKEITEGNNRIYEVLAHGPSKETSSERNKEQATLSGSKMNDMLEEHLREDVQTSNKAKEQSEWGDIRPVNAEGMQRAYEKETQCLENEFTAESLDYVVISQEDLQDEIPHVQVASEDRESLGHDFDSGFDLVIDADQEMQLDHGDSGFEIIENEKSPRELTESSLMDGKGTQIDTYCYTCKVPIMAIDKIFGDHKDHDVTTIDNAINEMTEALEDLLEKLQESSLKTEDFVSKVEALFNDVETNCTETEKVLEEQNEKMVQKVISQHAAQRESFEEMKKVKMEFLHDQMISFQQKVDTAKEILERAAKDMEELDPVVFLSLHDEVNTRLLTAMESTASLDKIPSASALFEKCSVSSTREDQKILKSVPVPQTPKLKAQEPNSATSTSITVYWAMSEGDVIDCFQVYCMEEPQGNREEHALLEEYRVTVKESFCILEDLEPDKCYNVWVMAVNYTGCSFPSEKTTFKTAPSSPIIKAEECTVCWDTAVIRWSAAHPESTDSFTLEWCKQYSSEGEGLRSVAGIKDQQLKVTLQPNENYFFYVRAVNAFGSSEQSEAALISTKGTRFHLLRDTAHPALDLSPDGTVISISEQNEITGIPLVLGELLPAKGRHYWEMMVSGCRAYSVGATFQPSKEDYPFVQESTTWCMQCCSTSTSFSYKFLHNEVLSEVHLTEPPVRVGILLEYTTGRLSFYNVQKGNLLFSFRHRFTEAAHPTFVLEAHGELHLHTGIELPRFAKHS